MLIVYAPYGHEIKGNLVKCIVWLITEAVIFRFKLAVCKIVDQIRFQLIAATSVKVEQGIFHIIYRHLTIGK